jgi:hypothetical protein
MAFMLLYYDWDLTTYLVSILSIIMFCLLPYGVVGCIYYLFGPCLKEEREFEELECNTVRF